MTDTIAPADGRAATSPDGREPVPPKKTGQVWRNVKRVLFGLLLLGLLASFGGTLFFLYKRSKGTPPVVKTEKPATADITKKAVATGSIVPRREVLIKPRVSGIVSKIHVVPGQEIKAGDLIAEVRIIPDVVALTRAEGTVREARIAQKHAELELRRAEKLAEEGILAARDLEDRRLEFELKKAEESAAGENLQVVREGALAKGAANKNTDIVATVSGTVLDVPVEEGASVIEANNFNEGTTVAALADMNDMIFLGKVDEADVGKIKLGMNATVQIGAIENRSFDGALEQIASKGKLVDGAIQFEVKIAMKPMKDVVIRAGYSANAGIVLDQRTQVLALNEKLVQFDGDKPFVEILVGPNQFERRDISVGISDGIKIEVKSGVDASNEIKVPQMSPPSAGG